MANPLLAPLMGFLGRLSYPRLFVLTATLFAVDLAIPDFIPFVDELLLGLGTLLLANWKNRKQPRAGSIEPPPAPRRGCTRPTACIRYSWIRTAPSTCRCWANGCSASVRARSANAGWITTSTGWTARRSRGTSTASWNWRASSTCR